MGREAFSIHAAAELYLEMLDDPRSDAATQQRVRAQLLKLAKNADKLLVSTHAHLALEIIAGDDDEYVFVRSQKTRT